MYSKEELKQLKVDFWDGFGRHSRKLPHLRKQNKKWILYHTGIKHVELKFEVKRNLVQVIMEVNHRSESQRLDVFTQLDAYKTMIEACFDQTLYWDYLYVNESGKELARIYCEQRGLDFHRKKEWPQIYTFMSDQMICMEKAFVAIKDFISSPERI